MSGPIKTEAVVLKAMKYRETSKIVTFYTRDFGKVKAIAKGARQKKNPFGSALEPMSNVSIVLYKKDHREIQLVTQCDLLQSWHKLSESMDKLGFGLSTIELIDKVSHDEEENRELYKLLVETLAAIHSVDAGEGSIFCAFTIHLAGLLGFGLQLDRCVNCDQPIQHRQPSSSPAIFHIPKGGLICQSCRDVVGFKVQLAEDALRSLRAFVSVATISDAAATETQRDTLRELTSVMLGFLRFHIEGLHRLRSESVFARIAT